MTKDQKKKKKNQMKSQRKPRWNPAIAPSEPTPFSLSISLSHLSLRLWLGASPLPLIENPLKYCRFFVFAGVIPEMGGRTHLCGCARGRGRRVMAVAGGSYSLGYCRRRLGFDFFPLSLSLSLWVFLFLFFFWESCCGFLHQVEPWKINFLIWYWWIKFSF